MVVIQNIINDPLVDEESLSKNVGQLMDEFDVGASELLIRIVSPVEIQVLNNEYRSKNQVTNVLAFPGEIPEEVEEKILGDVVICADVVREEAIVGGKEFSDHLTHLAIHGLLHLLGYDHHDMPEAIEMEALEIDFLHKIGISDPYQ
jgi:probable rRNA maturation factor